MQENSKSLYKITTEGISLIHRIVESGGEIDDAIDQALQINSSELAGKADAYSAVMDRLDNEAMYWKAKADECARVARSCSKAYDTMKDRIKAAMLTMSLREIEGEDVTFKLKPTTERLEIDAALLPPEWKMTVTDVIPDKERIKKALAIGESVPGCRLAGGFSFTTSARRRVK